MSIDKRAISVKSYIGTEATTDTYATHLANLGRGGCHSVDSNAQRNLIPVDRRRRFMLCVVADVGNGNPGLYWLNTPPNPTTSQLANNSFWEIVPIGFQLDGVLNLRGFVAAANLDLEDGTGSSGDLWIVDTGGIVQYPEIFNGAETTLQAGDFIIYLNDKWNLVLTGSTSVNWNNLAGKPNLFPPEAHTHTISDITDFPDLSGVITNDRITGVIADETDGTLLATVQAIKQYVQNELAELNIHPPNLEDYYTKGEVDTEITNAVNAIDNSNWEEDDANTIKPKDGKTVTTEYISGLSDVATSNDYEDLDNKPDLSDLHTQNTDTILAEGTEDEVSANQIRLHIEDSNNPHSVTKEQLGVDESKWEENTENTDQIIPKDSKTIPASIIDDLPDGSNWEADGVDTIKPKDNKKVDASHIENLPSGYDSSDFDTDFATKTTDDLTEGTNNKYLTGNEFQKNTDDLDDITEGTTNKHFTQTEKTKLSGIEEGAEVNEVNAADIANFETTTQLNARDTANRDRTNHTGTQLASTISDFFTQVRATVLTGLSTASSAVVTATDTVLVAFGKLQAQLANKLNTGANSGLAGTGHKFVIVNADGQIIREANASYDATTKTVTLKGGDDLPDSFVLRLLNGNDEVIAEFANDQSFILHGEAFIWEVDDSISSGNAFIRFNANRNNAWGFKDKLENDYLTFRSTESDRAVLIRQSTISDFQVGVSQREFQIQTNVGAVISEETTLLSIPIQNNERIVIKVKPFIASVGAGTTMVVKGEIPYKVVSNTLTKVGSEDLVSIGDSVTATLTLVPDTVDNNKIDVVFTNNTSGALAYDLSLFIRVTRRVINVE
jgi:hypothetical protein